jgi:hypothetical protein
VFVVYDRGGAAVRSYIPGRVLSAGRSYASEDLCLRHESTEVGEY